MITEQQKIRIGTNEIEQLFYKGFPVATVEQIATVHDVPVSNIHRTWQRHQEEFVEGEDYFRLDFAEASQLELKVQVSANGLIVFTEGGYLLLIKPMRDKVSWKVYREMRAAYFRAYQPSTGLNVTDHELMVISGTAALVLKQSFPGMIAPYLIPIKEDISTLQQDYKVLKHAVEETTSDGQRALDGIDSVSNAQRRELGRVERRIDTVQDEIDIIKQNGAMYTTETPPLQQGTSVWKFVDAKKKLLDLQGKKVPWGYKQVYKNHMRCNYGCLDQGEGHTKPDGSIEYDDELWAIQDLQAAYQQLGGDEKFKAEMAAYNHPLRRL